jgi:hypothetical protein
MSVDGHVDCVSLKRYEGAGCRTPDVMLRDSSCKRHSDLQVFNIGARFVLKKLSRIESK